MQSERIAELLAPFLAGPFAGGEPASLAESQLNKISIYIDILLRWNARINLTAVCNPEDIVTRHFGESLFAARHLVPSSAVPTSESEDPHRPYLLDVGSGAGFPGLPIKIWAPYIRLTLIESNHKKATFLREVIRALALTDANVFCGRAEDFLVSVSSRPSSSHAPMSSNTAADIVTLRAVEQFESILPIAARLLAPAGRFALLVGEAQARPTYHLLPTLRWNHPIPIPLSTKRVLMIGTAEPK